MRKLGLDDIRKYVTLLIWLFENGYEGKHVPTFLPQGHHYIYQCLVQKYAYGSILK